MCICICHTVQHAFAFVTQCKDKKWIMNSVLFSKKRKGVGCGTVLCYLVYLWYILYVFMFSQKIMRSLLFNWGWVVDLWNAILWQMMTATSFPSLRSLPETNRQVHTRHFILKQTNGRAALQTNKYTATLNIPDLMSLSF